MPAAVWYPEQNSATWYVSQHVNVRRHAGYSGRIIATNQVVACVQRDHAGQPAIESCADLARMRGRPRKGTNVVAFPKTPAHRPPRPPIPKPIIVNRVEHWVRTAIKVLRCDANGNPLIVKGKPATGIHSVFFGIQRGVPQGLPESGPGSRHQGARRGRRDCHRPGPRRRDLVSAEAGADLRRDSARENQLRAEKVGLMGERMAINCHPRPKSTAEREEDLDVAR